MDMEQNTKKCDGTDDVHVHFKTEDVTTHESEIQVCEKEKGCVDVHLGFLQIHHIYDIMFHLPHHLGKEVVFDPLENLLVKLKGVSPTENGHQISLEFNAHKEKLMKEKLTLKSAMTNDELTLVFHARVLGKHKGTPSLRTGIHCARIEADEEDESDWQGF